MQADFHTVDQIAALLELHPKTVRGFIRDGKLHASKIGKQYRITAKDLDLFTGTSSSLAAAPARQQSRKVLVSSVVDVDAIDKDAATRLSNSVMAVMNGKDPSFGQARADVIFYAEDNKAKIILYGGPQFTSRMLELIAAISN
ncbi:MAG: helix-turn-helix domain-containing protein [Pseudomonadales bacterium]|jgi:excisionase family DNA binding protein|nr:helix-turn-helix domain-containing protein [Pseudomonadales bacterium]MDP7359791.1 helix-turn-helix domain-containing protein [Pseudomonadales bacterium]MDP7597019.1 helix-turn-helix domain-containing protein [Pseudomonadales bacterium]HJN52222.1 helix-turn-helix domain-containing protein [Pseudomonadales bacterium]|tara:strand:- start:690 stop:1118 length:429 start_codon:yes stop_codon:yes gene_type:complete